MIRLTMSRLKYEMITLYGNIVKAMKLTYYEPIPTLWRFINPLIITFFLVFFFKALLGGGWSEAYAAYSGQFTSFLVLGIAFGGYVWGSLWGLGRTLQSERGGRTLELLLLSPMSLMSLLIGTAMVQMLNSSIDVVWMLFVGRFLFRIELAPNADFPLAALGALTAVISMASFGMFFAAIALTTRHAWVIQSTLNQLFQFLGGMFFPVELLHELSPTLYQICSLFPVTQALNVTRNPLLMAGTTLQSLQYSYLILITESVLFFSSGYLLLRYMRKVAKERGTYLYV